ncbi:MAG: hypothetical protein R3B47_15020 [Bacteroidia bacterium]
MIHRLLFVFGFLGICISGLTQQSLPLQAYGYPFIQNFGPDDYPGLGQNWAVVQDSQGLIYVANGNGVLQFDGVSWRNIEIQSSHVRGIGLGPDGKIYVGAYGNIGYLAPDSAGSLGFHSIDLFPEAKRNFEVSFNLVFAGNKVYLY